MTAGWEWEGVIANAITESPIHNRLRIDIIMGDDEQVAGTTKTLHRCKTAPALAGVAAEHHQRKESETETETETWVVKQAVVMLMAYLGVGVGVYCLNRGHFSGEETHPVVDALYFCIVTMCTIGYGDIAPLTPFAKAFACVFVLVGFGFVDILLSGLVNYVLDLQEATLIRANHGGGGAMGVVVDANKGRMRIRLKVGLALGVVVLCVGAGLLFLRFAEGLSWTDSFYLSIMSVTTVGYGDKAFNTLSGRIFAALWLLLSTLAVARAFLFLAEARLHKRQRRIANWVLHRQLTLHDLLAADFNHNHDGFICKSEYVIYKLKEMGKIQDKDILQICNQFTKLDPNNSGKITLPHLLGTPSL